VAEPKSIRILLAEDHHVIRHAVALLLARQGGQFDVVGEVADGGAVLMEAVDTLEPDLLLLDAHMPGYDLISDVCVLRGSHPELRILILSAYARRGYVLGLLNAGALGYVHKGDSPEMLLNAIRAVSAGKNWVSPNVANVLLESMRDQEEKPESILTPRELDVLRAMATGVTNKEIGDTLFISEQTVKNHASNIFAKLGVETRVEAVLYALRHGLVQSDEQ
jgi:DNA-binding NarL/FixJ family response regulator